MLGSALFAGAVALGTLSEDLDPRTVTAQGILEADLHVHPFPGDGALPVWELRREAARRGLDVIAVTAHNNRFALDVGGAFQGTADIIVLPGQEITAPRYHVVAVGTDTLIDWRLTARQAIEAVHAQGGIAIAAHPVETSWRDSDPAALALLDGAEVAHPAMRPTPPWRDEYLQFFLRLQRINPDAAPIGSTDFHTSAPLGLCRTYLLTDDRSAGGVLDAIRRGRTVARRPNGRLHGSDADVAVVERYLSGRDPLPGARPMEQAAAFVALAALALLSWPADRRNRR